MDSDNEVIALLLDSGPGRRKRSGEYVLGAQRLVRTRDGRMSLEDVESEQDFERTARTTGCFCRGKAIRDPATREIIGYEMEEVSLAQATARW